MTRRDRLARSARDTLAITEELGARGVTLKILDAAMTIEPPGSGRSSASPEVNSSMAGAISRMILTVMAAMARLEREVMLERQREGIARAKAKGKYKGQPPHARAKSPQVIKLAAAGHTRTEIVAVLDISERSIYRILAETTQKPTERRCYPRAGLSRRDGRRKCAANGAASGQEDSPLTLQRQGARPCRRGHTGCRDSGRGGAGPCGGRTLRRRAHHRLSGRAP